MFRKSFSFYLITCYPQGPELYVWVFLSCIHIRNDAAINSNIVQTLIIVNILVIRIPIFLRFVNICMYKMVKNIYSFCSNCRKYLHLEIFTVSVSQGRFRPFILTLAKVWPPAKQLESILAFWWIFWLAKTMQLSNATQQGGCRTKKRIANFHYCYFNYFLSTNKLVNFQDFLLCDN